MAVKTRFRGLVAVTLALAGLAAVTGIGRPQVPSRSSKSPDGGPATVAPSMQIDITGPTLTKLGDKVTLRVRAANNMLTETAAKGLLATVSLPGELEFVRADPQGTLIPACGQHPAIISWTLPDIAPGKFEEMTITARAVKPGSYAPKASLCFVASLSFLKILGSSGLAVSSGEIPETLTVGQTTTQMIEVRNEGTAMCTAIVARIVVTPELEISSAVGPWGETAKSEGGEVRFEASPILAPGEKLTYRLVYRAVKEGPAKRTLTLTHDESPQPIIEERAIVCVR
jgi:hypothetical protein